MTRFRWALLDLRLCFFRDTLSIWCTTDKACHIILRWSDVGPGITESWPERRGIPHRSIDWAYPMEWKSIEQNEPGDTKIHTFTWPFLKPETTYWYILTTYLSPYQPASHSGPYTFTTPVLWYSRLIYNEPWTS